MIFSSVKYMQYMQEIAKKEFESNFFHLKKCSNRYASAHIRILSDIDSDDALFLSKIAIYKYHPVACNNLEINIEEYADILEEYRIRKMFYENEIKHNNTIKMRDLERIVIRKFSNENIISKRGYHFLFYPNNEKPFIRTELFFDAEGRNPEFRLMHSFIQDTETRLPITDTLSHYMTGILPGLGIDRNRFYPFEGEDVENFAENIYYISNWFSRIMFEYFLGLENK